MTEQVSLPAPLSPSASIDELREHIRALDTWVRAREPQADGGATLKFLTVETAVSAGLLVIVPGLGGAAGAAGAAGNVTVPGGSTATPADASQPTPAFGLAVTSIVTGFFIEIEPPTYIQGGGNGRTVIYRANYAGAGPLPTFANAVEVGYMSGRSTVLVLDAEPGVQAHFWAKSETRHPTLQATPTGGTNGVSATAGLLSNDHISSLSVSKLVAGTLAVGEYIESTGFDPGVEGFRLNGDGTGYIGGLQLGEDFLQSANYVAGTTGFFLGYDGVIEVDDITARGDFRTGTSGQRIALDSAANELQFYADGGAGVELIAKIGIDSVDLGDAVGIFGTSTSGNAAVGLMAFSDSNCALASKTAADLLPSIQGRNTGDGDGVEGFSEGAGAGVYAWSNTGPGGAFDGNATKGQFHLDPLAGRPSSRVVGGVALLFTTGGSTDARTGTPRLMYADGSDWCYVSDDTVYSG